MSEAGLKVMGGRVLVKPIEKITQSASGIVLTDKHPPTFGRVVAIGTKHRCPECTAPLPVELRIGVIVGFSATAGQDVTMNGETYTVLRLEEIQFEWAPEQEPVRV